ncbi:hypothetical protein [Hansschlegelia plantiphila]|uniref:Uncharacterized protein n=1 Tax=Hansschlegelia plantiphila TaxID=374655 RepID=A0A9W6IZM1_9HYPH|nr:hypothetical protein [Hansschlegelia plantiphila]GLK67008.1 hypothetical protein GCM10008179_06460 [Hansschlegelia plantiphila]
MPKYTNTTRQSLDFVIGGTPADPKYASFKAGETKEVELNLDHPAVAGALKTGALLAADASTAKRVAKAEALPPS